MTKSQCQVCNATFRGIPLYTVKDGKQVEACPTCYKRLDELYRKTSCLACVFFNVSNCELFHTDLDEPYINSATCNFFTTDNNPETVAKLKIKKLESSGRFEDAAKEYEKLGLTKQATEAKQKAKVKPRQIDNIDQLVELLTKRGQILTYYCCHCGESLKVGRKNSLHETCPHCKCDLKIIDMVQFINQHI